PYTEALLRAAPRPDPSHKTDHVYLVGEQPSALDRAPGCPLYGRCPIAEDVCADTPQVLVDIGAQHRVACWKRT
ncbi:MAG: peptide ABC transporter substrate-binding protein, partial [Acidimicrobiia bacterium]|nr:peptide ABC transporter substrate-binding protein [Acidimicrobiia bacterium]